MMKSDYRPIRSCIDYKAQNTGTIVVNGYAYLNYFSPTADLRYYCSQLGFCFSGFRWKGVSCRPPILFEAQFLKMTNTTAKITKLSFRRTFRNHACNRSVYIFDPDLIKLIDNHLKFVLLVVLRFVQLR